MKRPHPPAGRHAKPTPEGRAWPWWVEYLLEVGRENIWGLGPDEDVAPLERDDRPWWRPLGAWWDDWAQPRLGRAFFISAGATGGAAPFAADGSLPTWLRLLAALVLGLVVAYWCRELLRWLSSGRPPIK